YRTAKQDLEKHGFATFRATGKGTRRGTIAKLIDTRVFDINAQLSNGSKDGSNDGSPTDHRRITDGKQRREEGNKERTEDMKRFTDNGPTLFDGTQKDATASTPKKERFSKPTLEEVKAYADEIGLAHTRAEDFHDYWQEVGWKRKGQPIV